MTNKKNPEQCDGIKKGVSTLVTAYKPSLYILASLTYAYLTQCPDSMLAQSFIPARGPNFNSQRFGDLPSWEKLLPVGDNAE